MARALNEVVYVDGVRTAFGRAGPKGIFWKTRADDMAVKVVRELLRRNPEIPAERIGDVAFAATAQVGDQGLTLGRDVALLAGIPQTVPGFAVDRMCAGALTAVTAGAGEIAMGAADVVLAGGVEHMGHHPMGDDVDFNPRFVAERLIEESAAVMGQTAENLHDEFPELTKADADDAEGARAGRPDARRHRPVRAERAVRRPGAHLVPRPRRRPRGRAPEPVRRRDRVRTPARRNRRPADGPARVRVRRASERALRLDRALHRHGHGRLRDLGKPGCWRLSSSCSASTATSRCSRSGTARTTGSRRRSAAPRSSRSTGR